MEGAPQLETGHNDYVVTTPIFRVAPHVNRLPPSSGHDDHDHWNPVKIPLGYTLDTEPFTTLPLPDLEFLTAGPDHTLSLHWDGGPLELRVKNNQSGQAQTFPLAT